MTSIDCIVSNYKSSKKSFTDALALVKTHPSLLQGVVSKIEKVENWQQDYALCVLHDLALTYLSPVNSELYTSSMRLSYLLNGLLSRDDLDHFLTVSCTQSVKATVGLRVENAEEVKVCRAVKNIQCVFTVSELSLSGFQDEDLSRQILQVCSAVQKVLLFQLKMPPLVLPETLRELYLEGVDFALANALCNANHIETITIRYGKVCLPHSFPKALRSFTIENTAFTDQQLKGLFTVDLEELRVYRCSELSEKSFENVRCPSSLRKFSIAIQNLSAKSVQNIIKTATALTSLSIAQCGEHLMHECDFSSSLQELSLQTSITADVLNRIFETCTNLSSCSLTGCTMIDFSQVQWPARLQKVGVDRTGIEQDQVERIRTACANLTLLEQ